jgi:glycosyltransferase involved in cell wall biosynthesis
MCNVPLVAMLSFVRYAKRVGVPWIFWHQDIYSAGLADELRRRLPGRIASMVGHRLEGLEAWCARNARHIVAIGESFTELYPSWGVPTERVSVIPNWAPLNRIVPTARSNRRSDDLFDAQAGMRLLYAGTLGRKHNPLLLVALLETTRAAGVGAHLTVVSEGEAANDLRAAAAANPQLPLRVVPFQPASDLSDILGSADVLLTLLETDATTFSIPSKVLSYMAAGRPILGLMPADNPAAANIEACGGYVDEPTAHGARRAARWLVELVGDPARQAEIGRRSRSIAEQKFDLDDIAARFVAVLEDARASARL